MSRVLLTHSYFLRFDPKQWRIMQPYPPLGTLYAGAVLREAGHKVTLWDPMFRESPEGIVQMLESERPDVFVIYDDGFNYLTKMCLTNMRDAALRMIHHASERNIPVLVCSSDASDHYEKYLDAGATAIIRGEGELTLRETVQLLSENKSLSNVEGLAVMQDGKARVNNPREILREPDQLPFPAWDLADIGEYRKRWMHRHGYFSMNMSTTRGCPFKCNWCAKPIYGNRYNSRSPENVLLEIGMLKEKYKPDHIWFCDDIFGLKPGWVTRFAERANAEALSIRYKIQSRVDLLLQENNIAALARSGCETVWVGAESGSQKILDAMDKGTRVEQIYEATRLLKKHHIKAAFFLQYGYPGETFDDIRKTISMVEDLLPDDIGISVSYPLPGTVFYENVKNQLALKSNWTDSDELALMFRNTYPASFYRHLHRYTHKRYRVYQGKRQLMQWIGSKGQTELTWRRVAGILFHRPGMWYHRQKMLAMAARENIGNGENTNQAVTGAAFDAEADRYDKTFTHTVTGRLQRDIVHKYISKNVNPSEYGHVLELNGGTGEDAGWLAQKGFRVLHSDASARMVELAREKSAKLVTTGNIQHRVLPFEQLDTVSETGFDLVFSNFGGLNCVASDRVRTLTTEIASRLRPGGKFIAVIMGRKCLWEKAYFSYRKNPQARNRRKSTSAVRAKIGDRFIPVWYYSPREFGKLAAPNLRITGICPVGFFIPPSYLDGFLSKHRLLGGITRQLEQLAFPFSSLSDYADHYLIEFTRT